MLTFFNSKSLWIGKDMKEFNRIRGELDNARITYKYKVKNRMGQFAGEGRGTIRGQVGSMGTPTEQMYEYEIFVHKDDIEKAGQVMKAD